MVWLVSFKPSFQSLSTFVSSFVRSFARALLAFRTIWRRKNTKKNMCSCARRTAQIKRHTPRARKRERKRTASIRNYYWQTNYILNTLFALVPMNINHLVRRRSSVRPRSSLRCTNCNSKLWLTDTRTVNHDWLATSKTFKSHTFIQTRCWLFRVWEIGVHCVYKWR